MDVISILYKIGYTNLLDCGKDFRTSPIYRASDNKTSLCINKTTGQWYDFSAREGGSILGLVKLTLRLSSMQAAKDFLGDETIDIEPSGKHRYELQEMKKFDKLLLNKLDKNHEYWIERGITSSTIETFQGGVTFNGRMCYRYVFPIFNSRDEIIGFSGRRLNDNEEYPKWKHLGAKTKWCYPLKWNKDILIKKKEVILIESIGDMLSLWDAGIRNTMVTFGIDLSVKIIEFLLKIDVQKIHIAFNNDEGNNLVGNHAAIDCRKSLMRHFDSNQVNLAIPKQKDFGEMDTTQISLWKEQHLMSS